MRPEFQRRKKIIIGTLAILLVVDGGLAIYSARLASVTPQPEVAGRSRELQLLKADVSRGLEIEKSMPVTKADCERFENALPPAGAGYSAISAELQEVGQKSGLQIGSLSFRPKEIAERGVTEVTVDASVNGDYKNVVQFLDGLQHSKNHYIIDDLNLGVDAGAQNRVGELRVNLHLRSYFRAGA